MAIVAAAPDRAQKAPSDLIPIGQAARLVGASQSSLRNWVSAGIIQCYTLGSSHRRFSKSALISWLSTGQAEVKSDVVILYSRVSSSGQAKLNRQEESNLTRQQQRLREYAKAHYPKARVIEFSDTSSGLNYNRKGLTRLLEEILSGLHDGATLIVEFRDRITRFALEWIELICRSHNVQIVYVEQQDKTDEELLSADLMAIIFVFGIRSYARRGSEKRRRMLNVETLKRGKELLDSGYSSVRIKQQLQKEGHVCSIWTVKRYIKGSRDQLEKVMPANGDNSVVEYYKTFAMKGGELDRLPKVALFDHYERWCRDNNKLPMTKVQLLAQFNKTFKISFHQTHKQCYRALRIKGTNLHVTVRSLQTAKLTPTDGVLEFAETIAGKTLDVLVLMDQYKVFAQDKYGPPLNRKTVVSVLSQMGGKMVRRDRAWFISMP